ncbi:MAG: hypothetical protein ACYDCQ_06135 [Dehalococcoidia bacterium]
MKKWLLSLAVVGGIAMFVRKKLRSGYDEDWVDSADEGDFGDRGAPSPEQKESTARTRTDTTPEKLSLASRLETSSEAITTRWPGVSAEDVAGADGDIDKLAHLISSRSSQPQDEVRTALDGIIAEEAPGEGYPGH